MVVSLESSPVTHSFMQARFSLTLQKAHCSLEPWPLFPFGLETFPAISVHVLKSPRWSMWEFQIHMAPQNLPSDTLARKQEPTKPSGPRCVISLALTLHHLC